LGTARRPPPVGLLAPLLGHWGLDLGTAADRSVRLEEVEERRLAVAAPGSFRARSAACEVEGGGLVARCSIGRGKVLLVADADLLHDGLWAAPHLNGESRHRRVADNPLVVSQWLDQLAGVQRSRAAGEVAWSDPGADRRMALLLAFLPIAAAGIGGAMRLRRKS